MIDQIYMQMRAMQMLTKSQDITADNLANLNTPGFKGNKIFHQMMEEQIGDTKYSMSTPMQHVDLSQGVLEATGNPFDFAIEGDGFFTIQKDGQTLLSRNGRFHLNEEGLLVDDQGGLVQGTSGPINLSDLMHQEDGQSIMNIELRTDGSLILNGETKGQLQITTPNGPEDLSRKGAGYFSLEGRSSAEGTARTKVVQGFYEKGNVDPMNEMVDMMQTMQLFESQQKAMRTTDEILTKVTSQLGRF